MFPRRARYKCFSYRCNTHLVPSVGPLGRDYGGRRLVRARAGGLDVCAHGEGRAAGVDGGHTGCRGLESVRASANQHINKMTSATTVTQRVPAQWTLLVKTEGEGGPLQLGAGFCQHIGAAARAHPLPFLLDVGVAQVKRGRGLLGTVAPRSRIPRPPHAWIIAALEVDRKEGAAPNGVQQPLDGKRAA